MFATDAEVKSYARALLAKDTSVTLKDYWDTIVSNMHSAAYQFILNWWGQKGYSKQQIADWDFGSQFEIRLAGYLSLARLSALYPDSYSQQALALLDPRKELAGDKQLDIPPAMLVVDGEVVDPEGTRGSISTGLLDTSEDLFVPFNADDPRRGQITRW